jgi:hydroxymethylpyrimidine kinase/phosphomethylpyrimidine kinase/thiamine-phosphate diphosphorylase
VRKFALTIAGSDSSGGAGIQADLRVWQSMGVHAATAITAVTAQGSKGVTAIQLMDPNVLERQIEEAFNSYSIGGVKIGMLGTGDLVSVVVTALRKHKPEFVVIDPVLVSTTGTALLDESGATKLVQELMPLATLVTPNIRETEVLTGIEIKGDGALAEAGNFLLGFANAVLVKGGHLTGAPDDTLFIRNRNPQVFHGKRVRTDHARGTGCFLSAGILGMLLNNCGLETAIMLSKLSLEYALAHGIVPKRGYGYPFSYSLNPTQSDWNERMDGLSGVYFVTDAQLNKEVTHMLGAQMATAGGAKVVQLRDKVLDTEDLVALGIRIRDIVHARGAIFIQNDRADIAKAVGADGVHLGPGDLSPEAAREILGCHRLIGVSVSTVEEAKSVAACADYLAVGAIFGSSTKGDAGDPVGVERITEIKNAFPDKKIVAIGGINLSNIASVAAAGADAAAVVSAIVCAPDTEQATRDLLAEFERGKGLRASQ